MGNSKSKRKQLKINSTGLLILCKNVTKRPQMILFGQTLEKGHDPIYCCSINTETATQNLQDSQSNFVNLPENVPLSSQRKNDKYFYKLTASKSLRNGTQSLLQLAGMQSIKPNSVIIGFKRRWKTDSDERINEYVEILSDILIEKQMGIIICCGLKRINWFVDQYIPPPSMKEERFPPSTGIDIWCIMDDGGSCILIPYIMSLHPYWKNYKLNLKIVSNINLSKINRKNKEKLIFGFIRIHQNKIKKKVFPKSIILIIYSFYPDESDVDELKIKEWITKYNLSSIYDEPQIITAQNNEPHSKTIEMFETLSKCKLTDLDQTNFIKKWLIFYQLLFKHSAALNVISLPILTKNMKPKIYMALLQMMCDETIYPPTIFIRGNEKLTQTIYSK